MPSTSFHSYHAGTRHTTHLHRRDGGSSKLPTSTIIAISVACGCLFILLLTLFLWRLLKRLFRPSRPAPLPPVQPLAHHREQQLAAFNANPSWTDGSSLKAPYHLHATSSDVSLLPPGTPKDSLYADEATTAESLSSSTFPSSSSPLSLNDPTDIQLLPHRYNLAGPGSPPPTASDSSSFRDSNPSAHALISPSDSVPHSETTASSSTSSTHPLIHQQAHPHTPSPSRNSRHQSYSARGRPISMVSSYAGSTYSATPRNSTYIRGAPHSIHSNVQIVLPASLAPQLTPNPYFSSSSSESPSKRSSVFVDRWVNVGQGGGGGGELSDAAAPSSWTNSSGKRRSHRQSLPVALPSSSSVSSSPSGSTRSARRMTQLAPPVPRLPLEYTTPTPSPMPTPSHTPMPQEEMDLEGEMEEMRRGRGRERTVRRMSSSAGALSEKASEGSLQLEEITVGGGKKKPRTLKKTRPEGS